MPRTKEHSLPTRQLYASIREDIYLAAKAKATELRLPLRRFIEDALEAAIHGGAIGRHPPEAPTPLDATPAQPSVWDDQYIGAQARQPLGAPLELSEDEARRVALSAFDPADPPAQPISVWKQERLYRQTQRDVGAPVDLPDEDAAQLLRAALERGGFDEDESA